MTLATWIALTLAGGAGALARYGLDVLIVIRAHERFPYGILAVNLSGAFSLGFITAADGHPTWLRVVGLGFLGAFTTFSTWMLDSQRLAQDGRPRAAVLNVVVSLFAGLLLAFLGRTIGVAVL